jgi:hypothetical protein
MKRTRFTRLLLQIGLVAAAALGAQLPCAAHAATRQALVRWQVSSEQDVVRYRLHVGLRSGIYETAVEVESFDLDASGVASTTLTGIDEFVTYYFAVSAVDAAGQESLVSNEIALGAASCAPGFCDDRNACTVDACAQNVCGYAPVADGSVCDDRDPLTTNDACRAGVCAGVVPPPPPDPTPDPTPAPGPGRGKGKKPRH